MEFGSTRIKALVIVFCGCSTAFAGLVRMSANAPEGEMRELIEAREAKWCGID